MRSVEDVKIEIAADMGNTSATINDAADGLDRIGDAAGTASSDLGQADNQAGGLASTMDKVGVGALGAAGAFASMGDIVNGAVDLWNTGEQRADDLARAQNDVAQAALDVKQANQDMRQSQIDANQAQIDGTQSGIDLKQALLDQKVAQKDYNDAVKEFGPNSLEAQQAQIDLAQADADAKQAKLDGKQATEDYNQAQLDGKQAAIDAKSAQVDLNEAQRNQVGAGVLGGWVATISQVGTALFGLIGIFALFGAGTVATAATAVGSAIATAAAWVGSWIVMAASASVSAVTMAAAWLFSIWPIVLVVAAVVGLAIVIVKNWDTITAAVGDGWQWLVKNVFNPIGRFFTSTIPGWVGAGVGWIQDKWNGMIGWFAGIPGRLARAGSGMWEFITGGLTGALNTAISIINDGIFFINDNLIANANRIPGVDIPWIPYIPYLAEGGITTGPTLAMIGEGREQEAVLPLSKLQGLLNTMGGNRQVNVQINGGPFREYLQAEVRTKAGGDVNRYAGGN